MRNFFKSFKFAFRGIRYAVLNERNVRVHLVFCAYIMLFSFFYDFSRTQYAVVFLTLALVLCAELLNTAVEVIVNLHTTHFDQLARVAKDVAAGAVLLCAIFAVGVGIVLFWDTAVFAEITAFFKNHRLLLGAFVLSLGASVYFVVFGKTKADVVIKRRRNQK